MSAIEKLKNIDTTELRLLADWIDLKYLNDQSPEVQTDLRQWADDIDQALADLQAPPETMLEKGQALKQFRLDVLNMGLRRFAEWIGLRPSYLANVEHGRAYWQTPEIDEKGNITTPDQQAPQGEFTKGLREHLSLITPNLVLKAEYDVPPESLTEFLAEVKEACDRLDRQAEERKRLQFDYERAINIYRLGSW